MADCGWFLCSQPATRCLIIPVSEPFSLAHTLGCGQFFRHWKDGEWYYAANGTLVVKAKQDGNKLDVESNGSRREVERFFALDHDLPCILKSINKDSSIRSATRQYAGLRILRQDPWQCLISFICSSASNIPRITGIVSRLSERYGEAVELDGKEMHAFPTTERLAKASLPDLKACGLGFRARFVHGACRRDVDLLQMHAGEYHHAHAALMQLDGVGEKVADCVCLFALEKLESFPTDVWVARLVKELYLPGKDVTPKVARVFGMEYFGKYAGYAQEYLYHWRRMQE